MKSLQQMTQMLRRGIAELSPRCKEASHLQSEALDRPLTFRQRLGLRIHPLLCKWCRRYAEQILFLRAAAGQHEQHEHLPQPTLTVNARERIHCKLMAEADVPPR